MSLTRGDMAFLTRTAATGEHPWAIRFLAVVHENERLQVEMARLQKNLSATLDLLATCQDQSTRQEFQ